MRTTFIEDLDPDNIKTGKKSYKNNLIYYIWYVAKCLKFYHQQDKVNGNKYLKNSSY